MKDTLIEVKNNLQGINSRVGEVENQLSDLEYKEAKRKQKIQNPNQNSKEKSVQKKKRG